VSSAAGDPYADPASGVLRNLLGITRCRRAGPGRGGAVRVAADRPGTAAAARPLRPRPPAGVPPLHPSATSTAGPASCAPCRSRRDRCSACRSTWSRTRRTCSAAWAPRTGYGAICLAAGIWPGGAKRRRRAPDTTRERGRQLRGDRKHSTEPPAGRRAGAMSGIGGSSSCLELPHPAPVTGRDPAATGRTSRQWSSSGAIPSRA